MFWPNYRTFGTSFFKDFEGCCSKYKGQRAANFGMETRSIWYKHRQLKLTIRVIVCIVTFAITMQCTNRCDITRST